MPSPAITEEEAAEELEALDQATADAAEEAGVGVDPDQAADATPEVLAEPVPNDGFGDGNEGFFDGVESHDESTGGSRAGPTADEPMDADPFGEVVPGEEPIEESEPHSFEDPINSGAARLAVIGMEDDEEKADLQTEFREVFEEFQLGHYGSETMHEYVLHGQDDVDPIWGLCGSALLCTVIVVWMRPDGDELIRNAKENAATIGRGSP